MKIFSINYVNLKLADFMNFIYTILMGAKSNEGLMELCQELVDFLSSAYERMEEIYARHRKNLLTPKLEETDSKRDQQYAYLRRIVDAERRSLIAEHKEAGEELWIVLEDYGRMDNLSYTSQTTKLMSLCVDLIDSHLPAVEVLGLKDAVELLQELNDEFQQLFYDRFESVAERTRGEMAEARRVTEQAYARLRLVVCGLYEWRYAVELAPFIKYVNTVIPRFRVLISQSGGGDGDLDIDPDEDPMPEEPDPDDPTTEDPTPDDPTPENPTPEDPTPENPGTGNGGTENPGGTEGGGSSEGDDDDPTKPNLPTGPGGDSGFD